MKEKLIIIGGGPAGLAAAIYAARAEIFPLVIAGAPAGGQLMLTSDVENFPGQESILGPELVGKMRAQAEKFHTKFRDDNVKSVHPSKDGQTITLSDGEQLESETLLIATGASALWLGLPNEQRLRGRGVSACATCDGFFFKNKVVAVVGGGDTAMEEAQTLTRFAEKVYLIHRKDSFRASKIMQKRVLENPKVEVLFNTQVTDVLGEQRVEGLQLNNNKTLEVSGLFMGIGHKPDTEFLQDSGILLDEKGYVVTGGIYAWRTQREGTLKLSKDGFDFSYQHGTNIPGIFAAGDVVDFVYRQASTAAGMGVAAALEIERYLENNTKEWIEPQERL